MELQSESVDHANHVQPHNIWMKDLLLTGLAKYLLMHITISIMTKNQKMGNPLLPTEP